VIYKDIRYSAEFKMEAVKRIERTGEPILKVADDLGVKPTTTQVRVT
jgi:transposase